MSWHFQSSRLMTKKPSNLWVWSDISSSEQLSVGVETKTAKQHTSGPVRHKPVPTMRQRNGTGGLLVAGKSQQAEKKRRLYLYGYVAGAVLAKLLEFNVPYLATGAGPWYRSFDRIPPPLKRCRCRPYEHQQTDSHICGLRNCFNLLL